MDSNCVSQGPPSPKISIQSGLVGQVVECNYYHNYMGDKFLLNFGAKFQR